MTSITSVLNRRLGHTLRWLLLAALPLAISSCGSDDNGDDSIDLTGTINLTKQSISEGEEVDASTTTQLVLTYDKTIVLSDGASITLNGAATSATTNLTQLTISLTLEAGNKYTVVVPANAVIGKATPEATANAVTVNFTTKAAPEPVVTNFDALTNANATAGAKKVYQFLMDNYGKTILSGAMGGVAWENGYADYLNATTGKYPAIVGYDYIHLPYSPANWIDYGKITPVQTAWNAGSIIQIGWHWRAPSADGESADKWDFNKSGTSFDITQALTEGTWQNAFIKKDIEKLAGYLKLLQDAGIPVLFRPLHEAAGDYKWGAWFWWGAKGGDPCKKMWQYLHDQLTNVYGLNNLIWVWTVQCSNEGKLASLSDLNAWYPGDQYVDIVGADAYFGADYKNNGITTKQYYDLVMESVGGKKMVVMSECGRLPLASRCLADGDTWGYFMTWYGTQSGSTWAPYAEWDDAAALRTKMNDSGVTHRDGLPSLK